MLIGNTINYKNIPIKEGKLIVSKTNRKSEY